VRDEAPILILGGTRESRDLASDLVAAGRRVITSLAGRTVEPVLPEGEVRVGGFGGEEGLVSYLQQARISLIADATHPFAAIISAHAAVAAARLGLPYLRLERPAWEPGPKERWLRVSCTGAAVDAILPGTRVLLTTGHKDLAAFFSRPDITGLARLIEDPSIPIPSHWQILKDRPPFAREAERALMQREKITLLVTKNAGGPGRAKLDAAADLAIPVLMIERPPKPAAITASCVGDLIQIINEKWPGTGPGHSRKLV
jgi:precorrin-6A/cobalt-precorrin-6A reductase